MESIRNLAILLFDDAEVLDFCGPFEVFSIANEVCSHQVLRIHTVAATTPVVAHNGLKVIPDFQLEECPSPDLVLLPGGIGTRKVLHHEPTMAWIQQVTSHAEIVMSVCTGSLLLAQAGLLADLAVTTHHGAFDLLRELEPAARVVEDRRFTDNGKVVTSAGISAGIDMSLHMVSRLFSSAVAIGTAKRMEYAWNPPD